MPSERRSHRPRPTLAGLGELEQYGLWALLAAIVLSAGFLVRELRSPRSPSISLRSTPPLSDRELKVAVHTGDRDRGEAPESAAEARVPEAFSGPGPVDNFDFFEPPVALPGRDGRSYPPVPGRTARSVVVSSGDTLEEIARRELGSARRWRDILACNAGLDPRRIQVGQELLLPGTVRQPSSTPRVQGTTYRVRSQDTLEKIALQFYGTRNRWVDIMEANRSRIPKPEALQVGTEIVIP